jgi:hypothetical protein
MAKQLHKNMTQQIVAERAKLSTKTSFRNQLSITKKLIIDYKTQITELQKQESVMNPSLFKIRLASLNNLLKGFEKEYQELLPQKHTQ